MSLGRQPAVFEFGRGERGANRHRDEAAAVVQPDQQSRLSSGRAVNDGDAKSSRHQAKSPLIVGSSDWQAQARPRGTPEPTMEILVWLISGFEKEAYSIFVNHVPTYCLYFFVDVDQ
jgi:hypothetical protein